MDETTKLKDFVCSIIKLHETNDFETLSSYIIETEVKADTWFNEQRFSEVCDAIKKQIGIMTSLEHITTLKRKTSHLTLWKTTYSKIDYDVLWKIIFDTKNNEITLMHINWEHI